MTALFAVDFAESVHQWALAVTARLRRESALVLPFQRLSLASRLRGPHRFPPGSRNNMAERRAPAPATSSLRTSVRFLPGSGPYSATGRREYQGVEKSSMSALSRSRLPGSDGFGDDCGHQAVDADAVIFRLSRQLRVECPGQALAPLSSRDSGFRQLFDLTPGTPRRNRGGLLCRSRSPPGWSHRRTCIRGYPDTPPDSRRPHLSIEGEP
jgi:hypothetical protein